MLIFDLSWSSRTSHPLLQIPPTSTASPAIRDTTVLGGPSCRPHVPQGATAVNAPVTPPHAQLVGWRHEHPVSLAITSESMTCSLLLVFRLFLSRKFVHFLSVHLSFLLSSWNGRSPSLRRWIPASEHIRSAEQFDWILHDLSGRILPQLFHRGRLQALSSRILLSSRLVICYAQDMAYWPYFDWKLITACFTLGTGNYQKNPCPLGNYCPEGGVTPDGGRTGFPIPCPAGTYGNKAGSEFSVCQSCPVGMYNNLIGQSACFPCGSSATSREGSTKCTCTGKFKHLEVKWVAQCLCLKKSINLMNRYEFSRLQQSIPTKRWILYLQIRFHLLQWNQSNQRRR